MKISIFSLLVLTALVASALQSMRAASKCSIIEDWLGSSLRYDGTSSMGYVRRLEVMIVLQENAVNADSPLSLDSLVRARYEQMVAQHAEARAKP